MDISLIAFIGLGFAIGTYGTVVGTGGGFILVPLLLLIFPEYSAETVSAISLAVVWANATSGAAAYARQRRIDYVTGLLFAMSSLPGAVAGALVVYLVPTRLFSLLFGLLLLGMTILLLMRRPATLIEPPLSGRGLLVRTVVTGDGVTYRYAYKPWQGILVSAAIGFVSSLFGIGGGVFHVPLMITLFHVPGHLAVASSQFILAFMSGEGAFVHVLNGTLRGEPLVQAIALSTGAVPGAQVGARIGRRLTEATVLRLLAIALIALSVRLIIRAGLGV